MNEQFTFQLNEYLNQPEADRDINAGAMMLLQLNRNRILYQNILRNPKKLAPKLFYELQKFLSIRLDTKTVEDVFSMSSQVDAVIVPYMERQTDDTIARGKRKDHDQLPEEIQALWFENGDLMRKMRSTHEKLKLMEGQKPCDRYPFLKELISTHEKYLENYESYDNFKVGTLIPAKKEESVITVEPKTISAHRKYLSINKAKLKKYMQIDLDKANALREKMQTRYDELIKGGVSFASDQMEELSQLGLTV